MASLSSTSQMDNSGSCKKTNSQKSTSKGFTLKRTSKPVNGSKVTAYPGNVTDNAGSTSSSESLQHQQQMSLTEFIFPQPPPSISGDVLVVHNTPASTSQMTSDFPPTSHSITSVNMSMERLTDAAFQFMLKNGVKTTIFPKVKFLDKDAHGSFSHSANSICGMMLSHCFQQIPPLNEAMEWWKTARPCVFRHHTVCRNNCIQALKNAYIGKNLTLKLFCGQS